MSQIVTPLNEVRINNRLNSAYWRVSVVENTGSTQVDLAEGARQGTTVSGDVLAAEYQRAGRGRLAREFISPPGSGLLFSIFFIPRDSRGSWEWLPLLASQAVFSAVKSEIDSDSQISLKWPNDLLLNDKKIAGLLCERIITPNGPGVIVGIGINVTTTKDQLPVPTASSFALEGFPKIDRELLLISILQNLTVYLKRWESGDQDLVEEYEKCSSTIGRSVRIELPTGEFKNSKAIGVEVSGALILEDGSRISVGDIVHLHSDE